MKRIITLLFFIFILILSCKFIKVKDKEIAGNVLFKNLLKKSEKIDQALISGNFKILGSEKIPPIYLKFDSECCFKKKSVFFRISSLNKKILDIYRDQDEITIINHIGKQYIKLNIERIDLSNIVGINFNPIDISYIFLGLIPYSDNMELIDFKWSPREYVLRISDNVSEYQIYLDNNEDIIDLEINNQYFDAIHLDSIKYKKNKEKKNSPFMLDFSTDENDIKLKFIINKASTNPIKKSLLDLSILKDYEKINSIDKLKIDLKE